MREVKDPEIKLFGKKIALPENGKKLPVSISGEDSGTGDSVTASDVVNDKESSTGSDRDLCFVDKKHKSLQLEDESDYEVEESEKDQITGELSETLSEDTDTDHNKQMMEEGENPIVSSESENSPKTPSIDEDSPTLKSSKTGNDQHDATNSEQKTLKKPDKIVPCPRCNSMDTKFCYYNNYNVNQPRHFCKSCQRYWTAGGTMRNVPVGAGRRKNKNSASTCHHIMISEALQAARSESPNRFHHATFKPNGTVLSFGPDSHSMASALNLADKNAPHGIRNGFYNVKHKNAACKGGENRDDCSSTTSNSSVEGVKNWPHEAVTQNINGFPTPVPCLPGVPWPIPWNAAVPLPAICPTGFPMPFCPPPYWNCNMSGPWNVPWLIPPPPPMPNQMVSGSDPNSHLGKHSREGDLLKSITSQGNEPSEQNNTILIPKTLRIDDPDEAARSSIWSTLGIEYDSVKRAGLFKSLQPKSKDKDHAATTSPVWQANPAALSRSLSFQERS